MDEYSQSLIGFDLNFLNEPPNNDVNKSSSSKNRRSDKALSNLKKKIITTSNLVEQCHLKDDQLSELEKNLLATKNRLKEACIETTRLKLNYDCLEKDSEKLRNRNKELENQIKGNTHKYAAAESNIRQLEQLLKDREIRIEKFKNNTNHKDEKIKELERTVSSLIKKSDFLVTQLCTVADVAFTKIILNKKQKIILNKFWRMKTGGRQIVEENTCYEVQNNDCDIALSDSEDSNEDLPLIQDQTKENCDSLEQNVFKIIDSDADTEVMSVDTGRGSSLANLNSPEYYADSPISHTNTEWYKNKDRYVDAATSPILVKQYVDKCTSPCEQEMNVEPNVSTHVTTVDKALSPIRVPDTLVSSHESIDGIEPLSAISEKNCLELNNFTNFDNDKTNDCEVEMILNVMKLTDRLTPIPPTPGRSAKSRNKNTLECLRAEELIKDTVELKMKVNSLETEMNYMKEKVVSLTNTLSTHNRQVEIHNDLSNGCNVTMNQESNDDTERANISKHLRESDDIPESVQHATPGLNKELSQDTNDKSASEKEANFNNMECQEQRTNGLSDCNKNTDIERKIVAKSKKLTRLEKLRMNMTPKSKIRKDLPQPRVQLPRVKKNPNTYDTKVNKEGSAVTLNDKDVYEKAVRVMAEIKSKQKVITPKKTINRKKIVVESGQKEKDDLTSSQKDHEPNNQLECVKKASDKETKDKISPQIIVNDSTSSDLDDDISFADASNTSHLREKENNSSSKSSTPQIESILSKTRKRYPSLSLDKFPVVVLTQTDADLTSQGPKKGLKRTSDNDSENGLNKIILRSSTRNAEDTEKNKTKTREKANEILSSSEAIPNSAPSEPVSYDDLDLFDDVLPAKKQKCHDISANCIQTPQESVLCKVIDDAGVPVLKHHQKVKVPETVVSSINAKLTESIATILELPPMKTKKAMDKMIKEMENWEFSEFMAGLMQYLMDPTRKLELLNKTNAPPAPPMTKSEQVLLYVLSQLRLHWLNKDVIVCVLNQIEYILFRLNQTPELKVVESMSHFYAILCRYIDNKSRLRMFMVNAMYCMQYSAVALVKQCIEVWMHILPLAHMGLAKSPMVTTLVYLLHFYKSEDDAKMVQDIRNILKHKYFFHVSDWDETKILEMFRNAIMEISDHSSERKMLRLSLLLLAKRHGTKWCQNKIINNMLLPIITEGKVPERVKAFCISLLGPLFKPYPEDMRVHCGIVINQLVDILAKKPSPPMEEVIYTSLICMSKHNQNRIIQALLSWQPKRVSPYMEGVLKDYVKEKPVKVWRAILSKIPLTT